MQPFRLAVQMPKSPMIIPDTEQTKKLFLRPLHILSYLDKLMHMLVESSKMINMDGGMNVRKLMEDFDDLFRNNYGPNVFTSNDQIRDLVTTYPDDPIIIIERDCALDRVELRRMGFRFAAIHTLSDLQSHASFADYLAVNDGFNYYLIMDPMEFNNQWSTLISLCLGWKPSNSNHPGHRVLNSCDILNAHVGVDAFSSKHDIIIPANM